VKKTDELEQVGGWWWTWKRLFTGKIFTEDGIWLNNRYVYVVYIENQHLSPLIHLLRNSLTTHFGILVVSSHLASYTLQNDPRKLWTILVVHLARTFLKGRAGSSR